MKKRVYDQARRIEKIIEMCVCPECGNMHYKKRKKAPEAIA